MAGLQELASARHSLRPRRPASIGFPQNRHIVDVIAHPAVPAVTVEHISDPTAGGQGIELVAIDAVQLTAQPLRARRVIVRLESATVVLHEVSTRLRTRTRVQEGQIAYVSFGAHSRGTIGGIAVGPGRTLDDGTREAIDVSIGQRVLYAKYAGTEFKIDSEELLIISQKDILAIVED